MQGFGAQQGFGAMMQCGDLVVLGDAVPQEYRGFHAIVTKVAESHCTVNDLDNSLQLGECWPSLHDVSLHSCLLRLGTHVVINGLACSRTKHFNGLASLDANEACMLGVRWNIMKTFPVVYFAIV